MHRPNRKSPRLQSYDYSTLGAYFITDVTYERSRLFSEIHEGEITLTQWGEIVIDVWNELPSRYPVVLDEIMLMPDHLHSILFIDGKDPYAELRSHEEADYRVQRRLMLLFKIMGYWKSTVTKRMRAAGFSGEVWGGRYWDRVIRDAAELHNVRRYIRDNPLRWSLREAAKRTPT